VQLTVPVRGSKARNFSIGFNPDISKNSKYWAAGALDWDSVHIQKFSAKTTFA
jgi:hypothetical protein